MDDTPPMPAADEIFRDPDQRLRALAALAGIPVPHIASPHDAEAYREALMACLDLLHALQVDLRQVTRQRDDWRLRALLAERA